MRQRANMLDVSWAHPTQVSAGTPIAAPLGSVQACLLLPGLLARGFWSLGSHYTREGAEDIPSTTLKECASEMFRKSGVPPRFLGQFHNPRRSTTVLYGCLVPIRRVSLPSVTFQQPRLLRTMEGYLSRNGESLPSLSSCCTFHSSYPGMHFLPSSKQLPCCRVGN